MLDGMSNSIQGSRIENLHSREVDRQSPTGLIFCTSVSSFVWTVLNERIWHFRGQNVDWPLLHVFRGSGQDPQPPWSMPLVVCRQCTNKSNDVWQWWNVFVRRALLLLQLVVRRTAVGSVHAWRYSVPVGSCRETLQSATRWLSHGKTTSLFTWIVSAPLSR